MKMLIDGRWVEALDGKWMDICNPGTGEVIDKVPLAGLQDVERAVEAAQKGKEAMRKLTSHERYGILMRIAECMERRVQELGQLLAKENGKPIVQTRAEVAVTANIFRGFAEEGKRIFGRVMPVDAVRGQERHFAITIRQPLGVENLLAANSQINAVFCENDSMCLGAQRAIADAGRTNEMFLCGVDGQKEALVQIKNNSNYACTGLNNSDQIGRAGFNRMMAILAGATPPKDTYLPSPLIDINNVLKYYDPNSTF